MCKNKNKINKIIIFDFPPYLSAQFTFAIGTGCDMVLLQDLAKLGKVF
jgi:hypothetical protein